MPAPSSPAPSKPSKFSNLLAAARDREADTADDAAAAPAADAPAASGGHDVSAADGAEAARRGPGRPPGKRSNPEFAQVTAYVRAETYRRARVALLLEPGKPREFSELIEALLSDWLDGRTAGRPD